MKYKCPHCGKEGTYNELYDQKAIQACYHYNDTSSIVKTRCCGKGVKIVTTKTVIVNSIKPVFDVDESDWSEKLNK